jgi:putative DNA methylase
MALSASRQLELTLFEGVSTTTLTAIEVESFPFEFLSAAARAESWRKEVNRPVYHLHKWWAQRLGSIFRGLVIGAALPSNADVACAFATRTRLPELVVFDPFMGSGTTVGEALKLGARAVGRDINPVAVRTVQTAMQPQVKSDIEHAFTQLRAVVETPLKRLYTVLVDGTAAEILYVFWVMTVECPACRVSVDLFSTRMFARHAYPSRFPAAQAVCQHCGAITITRADQSSIRCSRCDRDFPAKGPAQGATASCTNCTSSFRIIDALDVSAGPPSYRPYAKLVLMPDGSKRYLAADEQDTQAYEGARRDLAHQSNAYPTTAIQDGYNTRQVLRYGFTRWHELFNERQLLGLSILADGIRSLSPGPAQDMLEVLFSGTLEFNNRFASYKGEGTGAVRHMFSHHILKPERMPIEANLWGTPKSSGSFSGLYRSRVLRSLKYAADPFELVPLERLEGEPARVTGLSEPLGHELASSWPEFHDRHARLYLSCGDSQAIDLPSGSVDIVVTDPPFFDNVHYSELADFFYVWQRHLEGAEPDIGATTRSLSEVQHTDAAQFAVRLGLVFREARRVLKDDGLLVFTYHHSRSEGWEALVSALIEAEYVAVMTHPVKSEMAVATPKTQSRDPIDIDLTVVCRKRERVYNDAPSVLELQGRAARQVERMRGSGHTMGRGDVRVVYLGSLLPLLTRLPLSKARALLTDAVSKVELLMSEIPA